jgi:hypothetical protein
MGKTLREFGSYKAYWDKPETKPSTCKILVTTHGINILKRLSIDQKKFLNNIQQLMEENNLQYAWISVAIGDLSLTFSRFTEQKKEG